jgi:hypothetical protein
MATVTGTTSTRHIETRRLPRTTGALSGLLVILLGIWGALVPFFGPYFHYAFGSYQTWHYTSERLWLCILPGAVAAIGGLMLLRSAHRTSGLLGGWLALAAGAWFAIGPSISLLWHSAGDPIGAPMGGHTRQAIEWLGYFSGLGVLIAALAAFAMGRYYSRPRLVEEAAVAADDAVAAHDARTAERDAPMAERDAPVAATAAAEPLGAREEPLAARDEPLAARDEEPVAARDEPLAARDEPVAEREPLAPREEPLAPRDESATRADEPVASDEPATRVNAPGAATEGTTSGPATEGATTGPGAVTYRRRPGLSRLRGR